MSSSEEKSPLSENEGNSDAESESNDVEELVMPVVRKRKAETDEDNQKPKNKKMKSDFYKPPTVEELNSLKEAETVFHSSLFRLQIDELLKEVKLKLKWKQSFQSWIESFKEFLKKLAPLEQHEINDKSFIKKKIIKVPIIQKPKCTRGFFNFLPPTDVHEIGSFLLDTVCAPEIVIDIAVKIPKDCWQKYDYLNFIYHRKRALYLAYIAQQLKKCDLVEEMKFSYQNNNHLKPVLLIYPKGSFEKNFTVNLLPYGEFESFRLVRFIPKTNNVRPGWFFSIDEEDSSVPTPRYNASILADLLVPKTSEYLMEKLSFQNLKDGIILLKVWCFQRGLFGDYGNLNGFIITMIAAYALLKRKINPLMSSYQVFRNVLLMLTKENWCEEGVTFCQETQKKQPKLEDFHEFFDVVFIDPFGFHNICSDITKETYLMLHHEADLALKMLDNSSVDSFSLLFMNKMSFCQKFEYLIHFLDCNKFKEYATCMGIKHEVLDYGGNYIAAVLPKICGLLKKGLNNRVQIIAVRSSANSTWSLTELPPNPNENRQVKLGLLVNSELAFNNLEKGPGAEEPESKDFRRFWGNISELRRFQDGSISEAVVFPGNNMHEKRKVIPLMIKHILTKHAKVDADDLDFSAYNIEFSLSIPQNFFPSDEPSYGTGEEAHSKLIHSYARLAKELRNLEDLPLQISSVQGISSAFRYCEVFPPLPKLHLFKKKVCTLKDNVMMIKDNVKKIPPYVQPLNVVLNLERSGKWPNDLEAIKRVKAAFYIKIAEQMKSQFSVTALSFSKYVDLLKDGYIFRLHIVCHKEIALLKQVKTPEGILKIKETKEAKLLERDYVILPKLNSTLHGLHQQHNSYGTACRLAKRWLSAQLLHKYIHDVIMELLMASVYINPEPYVVPSCPQVAFLRFLSKILIHDWKTSAFIVNLNNELKNSEVSEIQSDFTSQRSTLPAMVIVFPLDKSGTLWTRENPPEVMVKRLINIAKATLEVFENQLYEPRTSVFKIIFRPPLHPYDALIHLERSKIARAYFAVDVPNDLKILHYKPYQKKNHEKMPVVGFDPVECYLQELRETFDDYALFFYDTFGSEYIAVVWKPDAFKPKPFGVSSINCCKVSGINADRTVNIIPNLESILNDCEIMGRGLVKYIVKRTEKWGNR